MGYGRSEEREHYQFLAIFDLFHRYQDDFDRLIAEANLQGGVGRVAFTRRFFRYYDALFGPPGAIILADHLLALSFQIRRAFHHIFRFFTSRTEVGTRLRSQVWDSIFTRRLFRYQKSQFQRMAEIPTLILGPSGSGKEVVARAIGLSRYLPFD